MAGPWEKYQTAQPIQSDGPWAKYAQQYPQKAVEAESSAGDIAQTALEGFGQGAALGYLPQLQAMAQPLVDRGMNLITGGDVEPAPWNQMVPGSPEYIQARDENLKRQEAQTQRNPGASLAGQAAGILATAVIPGKVAASSAKGAGIIKGALTGAAEAAALNPGDTAGEFNPIQVKERIDNAKIGALFGGGAGLVSKGVASVVNSSKDAAEKLAFKSSGAMLKDFRKASDSGKINDLGRFMLDKVLKAGDTFDDVAEKTKALKSEAGREIGKTYTGVLDKISDPAFYNNLDPAKKSALAFTGFKPVAQKADVISKIDTALGNSPNKKAAMSFVNEYLDDLGTKYGNDLDIVTANAIKGDVDKSINYGKRIQDLPEKQEALLTLRNHIRDNIENHIDVLDNIVGSQQVKDLRAANKLYGAASEIEGIAFDRVQRESSNRFFSLGDRVTGAATTAGGAITGAMLGGDVESAAKGAALGLGGAGLSRLSRKYGTQAGARSLDALSKLTGAKQVPVAVSSFGVRAANGPDFEKNENKPFLDAPLTNDAPKKGPEKWANDGIEMILKANQSDIDRDTLEKLKGTKEGKMLLFEASSAKDKKAMERVLQKIRSASRNEGE